MAVCKPCRGDKHAQCENAKFEETSLNPSDPKYLQGTHCDCQHSPRVPGRIPQSASRKPLDLHAEHTI
jgi:hypothetical protein